MSIKELRETETAFFADSKKEIVIDYDGKKLTFFANAISYFDNQNIGVQSVAKGKNGLAMLVAESITDIDGNKFTYDEVLKLKPEFAKPFFDAAIEINSKETAEKK